MRKPSPVTALGRSYATRYCEFCGEPIPKKDKNGNWHYWSKYKIIKTCGATVCVGHSQASTRPAVHYEIPDDPFNRFTRGVKSE